MFPLILQEAGSPGKADAKDGDLARYMNDNDNGNNNDNNDTADSNANDYIYIYMHTNC